MAADPTNSSPPSSTSTARAASRVGPWTIGRVLGWATDDLRARGFASPRLDVELLLGFVLDCDRVRLVVDSDRPLSADELSRYRELHKRRRRAEPVAYLRGEREFFGRPFRVDRRVLVPRPETEVLVEVALARTRHVDLCARVLDVCTGSGCVAITLAKERPTTSVLASDSCPAALEVARDNALRLGACVGLVCSDLFAALSHWRESFDLVTANPPYIALAEWEDLPADVRDFEPRQALDGGDDGLAVLRRLVQEAPGMLQPGGVLVVELGAGQAPAVAGLFEQAGLTGIERCRDYGGHERVVSGCKP